MKFNKVRQELEGIPWMSAEQGEEITKLILENEYRDILELGFLHGVSTCYMAAAVEELGGGMITTFALERARGMTPNLDTLLAKLNLQEYVTAYYEPSSYNWRLMKLIEEDPTPRFDFCYIDGAHLWSVDGFAFFLVDKLLREGGTIVFDDLDWTIAVSEEREGNTVFRDVPEEEKVTPQIRMVYELLVKQHPGYGEFQTKWDWGYARKISSDTSGQPSQIRTETKYETVHVGLGNALLRILRKVVK